MASLSNINGLFDVHSTGAILFSTSHGTTGQILRSNGDAAPTWIDFNSTGFGGDYLPLVGGILEGNLTINGTYNLTVGGTLGVSGVTTLSSTSTSTLTINGRATFPSAIANRPQLPGGFVGLNTGDGNFDIWGISTDYYPSNTTAANAWGLQWNGDSNEFRFVGGGSDVVTIDLDQGNFVTTGVITAPGGNSTEWNFAYDNSITALAVSGTTTKTLTATQQDGGTLTASWTDNDSGGTVKGTGTATRVAFWSANDTISSSADLYWDNTNARLAIGMTSTPNAKLHVSADGSAAHSNSTGIDVAAGAGGGNILALDAADNHNWLPYTNGDNYYSANNHLFRSGTGNSPYYMTINTSGNVGIGMGSSFSSKRLHVLGSNHLVTFENTSTTANHYTQMLLKAGTANAYIWTANQNSTNWAGANSLNIYTEQAGAIAFYTTAIKRMTIAAGGNVGIGTEAPGYKLDVSNEIRIVGGLNITAQTGTLYAADGALSYYAAANAVYLNGAGAAGWLRLNAAGTENNTNSINILGSAAGALINFQTSGATRMVIDSVGLATFSSTYIAAGLYGGEVTVGGSSTVFGLQLKYDQGAATTSTLYHSPGYSSTGNLFKLGSGSGNTNQLVLKGDGNVGIGTNSPERILHLDADQGRPIIQLDKGGDKIISMGTGSSATGADDTIFQMFNEGAELVRIFTEGSSYFNGGNVGIGTTTPTNTAWGNETNTAQLSLVGSSYGVITLQGSSTALTKYSMGVGGNRFYMAYDNLAGRHNIVVNSSGYVGIQDDTPSYQLDVTGTIRATGDVIAYSDARVKDNVKTIDHALEKTTKLRGVSYTRNDIEDKSTKIGVIAQEVLEVLPEVVSKDDKGKYSVSYGNIVGVLIEAIKELEARVKELENK